MVLAGVIVAGILLFVLGALIALGPATIGVSTETVGISQIRSVTLSYSYYQPANYRPDSPISEVTLAIAIDRRGPNVTITEPPLLPDYVDRYVTTGVPFTLTATADAQGVATIAPSGSSAPTAAQALSAVRAPVGREGLAGCCRAGSPTAASPPLRSFLECRVRPARPSRHWSWPVSDRSLSGQSGRAANGSSPARRTGLPHRAPGGVATRPHPPERRDPPRGLDHSLRGRGEQQLPGRAARSGGARGRPRPGMNHGPVAGRASSSSAAALAGRVSSQVPA